ncbi:MAG: DOMON-like domain-containing protein [Caulobacter sp.]
MLLALTPHPDTPCDAVTRIEVNIARAASASLALRFVAAGDIAGLRLPAAMARDRVDGLWKHSCFEVFIQPAGDEAYYEVNLSPSNRWAGYRFDRYREGMASPAGLTLTHMTQRASAGLFELVATLDLAGEGALSADAPWRLGLSAVIEEADGAKSYWALTHAPGKPDFHRPDTFAFTLESA